MIAHVGKLKDHPKNTRKERGDNPRTVEDHINESSFLPLIIDLWNSEKHGAPLNSDRSGKSPKLAKSGGGLAGPPQKGIANQSPQGRRRKPYAD